MCMYEEWLERGPRNSDYGIFTSYSLVGPRHAEVNPPLRPLCPQEVQIQLNQVGVCFQDHRSKQTSNSFACHIKHHKTTADCNIFGFRTECSSFDSVISVGSIWVLWDSILILRRETYAGSALRGEASDTQIQPGIGQDLQLQKFTRFHKSFLWNLKDMYISRI